jgi:hypothetical protein
LIIDAITAPGCPEDEIVTAAMGEIIGLTQCEIKDARRFSFHVLKRIVIRERIQSDLRPGTGHFQRKPSRVIKMTFLVFNLPPLTAAPFQNKLKTQAASTSTIRRFAMGFEPPSIQLNASILQHRI